MIRLLLLPTAHPPTFQRWWVRSSRDFYIPFNLAMGRSPGFASTTCDSNALLRLAFATAPSLRDLTLPQTVTRRLIMQKARGHPLHPDESGHHRAPTACRCMVSGSFNSPNRGPFHRSVTLLFTIGRRGVLSLGGWSPRLHTEFHELRATLVRPHRVPVFAYRTITFYGRTFQTVLLTVPLLLWAPATPRSKLLGLGSSAFARRY